MGVVLELFPLEVEDILKKDVVIDLVTQPVRPVAQRVVPVHADVLLRPLGPGQHVKVLLDGHVEGVVFHPTVILAEGLDLVVELIPAALEGQAQERGALLMDRLVIHLLGIVAPAGLVDLFGLEQLVLGQQIQVNVIGIARKGGVGGVGAVTRAGGDEGEKLPVTLARRFQEVHKRKGALSHGADAVGGGQRA